MCQAHGGTYNASTQSCSYAASTKTAKQTCEEQTGYYDPAAQIWRVPSVGSVTPRRCGGPRAG